ncbi:MAG: hypothetical protein ACLUI3_13335 [Christensenellales bacterium]
MQTQTLVFADGNQAKRSASSSNCRMSIPCAALLCRKANLFGSTGVFHAITPRRKEISGSVNNGYPVIPQDGALRIPNGDAGKYASPASGQNFAQIRFPCVAALNHAAGISSIGFQRIHRGNAAAASA